MLKKDGKSNDKKYFRHLLMNVRDAIPIEIDWTFLMSHTNRNMDGTKESFDKAIHFFSKRNFVHNHNKHCLISLNFPITLRVSSKYSMEEDEEKLDNEIPIVFGARDMLTSNLWTNVGILNGALGVVENILYNP